MLATLAFASVSFSHGAAVLLLGALTLLGLTTAPLFRDGFDHYGTSGNLTSTLVASYWSSVSLTATFATLTAGRWGATALRMTQGANDSLTFVHASAQTTNTLGFAFRISALQSSVRTLFQFTDGATVQLTLALSASNKLQVYRGTTAGTLLATSTSTIGANTWYHIEFQFKIDPSVGTIEVRVNGNSTGWIPPQTGLNTRVSASSSYDRFSLINTAGGTGNFDYDDLYVLGASETFQGDCRIQTLFANSNSATIAWSITGGDTSNFQAVAHDPPDDTKFVNDSTVGHRDAYNFTDVGTNYLILDVCVLYRGEKSDAGARSINPLARSGVTTALGTTIALGSQFTYAAVDWLTDPHTGVQWTATNLNAAQFGQDTV